MATSVLTSYFPITDGGEILVGAKVFVFEPGTTNLKNIYSDEALTTPLSNPLDTDADGFHPQAYLSGAYKIRIETGGTDTPGSGTLVRQWDNIDGGVPVGSGDLPVTDGGTGASTPAGARTNLNVPSQSEVDDLAVEVANLAGTLGSTGATQIATGTTAQRPSDLNEGQIRRNSETSRFEGYNGGGWEDFLTQTEAASQMDQETATSTTKWVAPGTMQYHPGVAKGWIRFTPAGSTTSSHNVSSLTDTGTGNWTVNWATDFSNTSAAPVISLHGGTSIRILAKFIGSIAAGTTTINTVQTSDGAASESDITSVICAAFGDQ